MSSSDHLIAPHGGELVDLTVDDDRAADLKKQSRDWVSWSLTDRQLCDLELLSTGAFSPLTGFMTREDHSPVCEEMRLSDGTPGGRPGTLWPMPITLDVDADTAEQLDEGTPLALRDPEGVMLAVVHVEDVWRADKDAEAQAVFNTTDDHHPAVDYLHNVAGSHYVGGRVETLELPRHYDFRALRRTPAELRAEFARRGWRRIVGFQTRNPMHRAHFELTMRAARDVEANLLIHPAVGMTKPGDVDHYTRVRVYQSLLPHYPKHTVALSLLELAMRMGGPREALWHAIIRKNHGCTHFIVGRDHAGPGMDRSGYNPYYGPYEAQEIITEHEDELGVEMVPFQWMVYVEDRGEYLPTDEVPDDARTLSISGTELRERLAKGLELPEWFTFPEVAQELRRTFPPRRKQGFTVFFTGLPSSGKSTVANVLLTKFMEIGGRPTTLLDGDIVRTHLSSELGFSKEDRDTNIRRIGFVASEIAKNGGIAICAPIAPYDRVRKEVRQMIEEAGGGFILVHISTPLEVAEERDRKGLYAKARAGIIEDFTGISDPYEEPTDPELAIDTSDISPEEAANQVLLHLEHEGYYGPDDL
ncbi:MAG: bifunctional sulfate adenylyltransferase/adenylylsulfate kinase [Actinobacteria bacterium]|nr:bifunctional sulfate adenylyltransferase/adenylylsulfate kinase [Actinomycetota bacterium]